MLTDKLAAGNKRIVGLETAVNEKQLAELENEKIAGLEHILQHTEDRR